MLMPKKEFPLAPHRERPLDIVVEDQTALALNVVRTTRGSNTIDGMNISYRYNGTRLEVRRGIVEEEGWTVVSSQPRGGVGKCTVNLGAQGFAGIGNLLVSGDIYVKASVLDAPTLRIGHIGVSRTVNRESNDPSCGSHIHVNDCAVGALHAHIIGGGIGLRDTTFAEPSTVIGHSYDSTVYDVTGDLSIRTLPDCNEACKPTFVAIEALQSAQ